MEIQVTGFEDYTIDEVGVVRSYKSGKTRFGKEIKHIVHKEGVHQALLYAKDGSRKLKKIHRLVALHFIPNPENKPTVNHKDGNREHNFVANLEWATYKEQIVHAHRTGLNLNHTETHYNTDLTNDDVKVIKTSDTSKWGSHSKLAKKYNIHPATLCDILKGRTWKNI